MAGKGNNNKEGGTQSTFSTYDEYGFARPSDFDYASHESFMSSYLPVLARRAKRWEEQFVESSGGGGLKNLRGDSRKLKRFVRKGVPNSHRPKVWMSLSGADQMRHAAPTQYADMLSLKADPHSVVVEQIHTDLHRTFPNNIYFNANSKKDPRGLQQPLFNVLLAYANLNPHVGYCQGMNYIVGLLLLVTRDEEESFFLLRALAERILPEYYGPNVPGLLTDIKVFSEILKTKCPSVHRHVESFSLPWALVCSKWFVCAFADVLPIETTLRLWDCLFAEGSKILLRAAIALVVDGENQKKILGCDDFADLAGLFKTLTVGDKTTRCHEFVSTMFETTNPMSSATIASLRTKLGAEVRAELIEAEEKRRKAKEDRGRNGVKK